LARNLRRGLSVFHSSVLRDPAPSEGGTASNNPGQPNENPPAPAPAAPAPAAPPAAETVITGTRTERETKLETDLQTAQDVVKDRETKIAELEDQISTLRKEPDHWRMFKL
jgi:hypothetical protein